MRIRAQRSLLVFLLVSSGVVVGACGSDDTSAGQSASGSGGMTPSAGMNAGGGTPNAGSGGVATAGSVHGGNPPSAGGGGNGGAPSATAGGGGTAGVSAGSGGGGSGGGGGGPAGDTWGNFAKGFMEMYCVSCHNDDNAGSADRNYHMLAVVRSESENIACGLAKSQEVWSARACSGSPPARQFPIGNGAKPQDADRDRILAWFDAGMLE
ncbi:MAG TPA: hypothetical protein VJN18_07745 [Polyangiaceae bacterium]|nr:hypothetical protein [Polyangiaceae bacterium]